MKTLGLIGGTSWVSTIDYYRLINQLTNEKLGGLNSAKVVLFSINFHEFKNLIDSNEWKKVSEIFIDTSRKLEKSGADSIVICASTPHYIADSIQMEINIPILDIAEATAKEVSKSKLRKVVLYGTKFTMEQDFFKKKLSSYETETIIPEENPRNYIHQNIFAELGKGIFRPATKKKYLQIIDQSVKGRRTRCDFWLHRNSNANKTG